MLEADDLVGDMAIGPESLDVPWKDDYFTDNRNTRVAELDPQISRLLEDISRLLDNPETPHETLWRFYLRLPDNHVTFLPGKLLGRFLQHLSAAPTSRIEDGHMNRFTSVLNDMRDAELPVDVKLWTTAIRFTGLRAGVDPAFRMWREMENQHGVAGNHFTFSVLFDLAVRNGQFALAEMVDKEARTRDLKLDRISRMSRIYYYGLLGDGIGVRRAYAQLVEAGEIVDTAVLTNVITALIEADELQAAEQTFDRMKRLHTEKQGATTAPHNWRQRRELKRLLTDAGNRYRESPENREIFQDAAPINPDWKTYRAFIRYHALLVGDYPRVESLLKEMRREGITMNKELFYLLFEAFHKHGSIRYSKWNLRNLEGLWSEFLLSTHEMPWETSFDPGIALIIVRAFSTCGGRQKGLVIWGTICERWTPPGHLYRTVEEILERREGGGRW